MVPFLQVQSFTNIFFDLVAFGTQRTKAVPLSIAKDPLVHQTPSLLPSSGQVGRHLGLGSSHDLGQFLPKIS